MVNETESKIESIDIANDDLIDVLASLVEYEQSNGASDVSTRLAVVGDGPHKMAMPTETNNVVEETVVYAHQLVEDGTVAETVTINGDEVDVDVL